MRSRIADAAFSGTRRCNSIQSTDFTVVLALGFPSKTSAEIAPDHRKSSDHVSGLTRDDRAQTSVNIALCRHRWYFQPALENGGNRFPLPAPSSSVDVFQRSSVDPQNGLPTVNDIALRLFSNCPSHGESLQRSGDIIRAFQVTPRSTQEISVVPIRPSRKFLNATIRNYGPIMVHESVQPTTYYAFGSHPHRVFSVGYALTGFFHGANAGSNPAGDAMLSMSCKPKL